MLQKAKKLAKSPIGKVALGAAGLAFPRQAASARNLLKSSAPIRKVVSTAVPTIINSKVTTSMTQTDSESYNFQVAGGPYASTASLEFLISPINTTASQGMAGQSWDPRMVSDSARYKEYKVLSCSVIYSGGVSTTQNGTLYIGSSKNPVQSFPLTSEFSSLEKSIKCTFTDPQQFKATHDSEWHPMPTEASSGDSIADTNVMFAGKVFVATAGGIQASWDAMKFDVHMVVQYRGRNPEYDILQSVVGFPLSNSVAEWNLLSRDSFMQPVPQSITSTYTSYPCRLGLYKYAIASVARDHLPCRLEFYDKDGVQVGDSRILLKTNFLANYNGDNAGAAAFVVQVGDGTSLSTIRSSSTLDRVNWQVFIAYCRPGDTLRVYREPAAATGIDDADYVSLNIIRVPRDKFITLLKAISPASDPRVMMPTV